MLLSGFCFSQSLIKSDSFSDSINVGYSSRQWVDIDFTNQAPSNGIVVVIIDSDSLFQSADTLFIDNYNHFVLTAPQTYNGESRAKFSLPDSFPTSNFYVCVNYRVNGFVKGTFREHSLSSLPTLTLSAPIQSKTYYTLQGQITTDPHGLVIEYPARKLVYIAPRE